MKLMLWCGSKGGLGGEGEEGGIWWDAWVYFLIILSDVLERPLSLSTVRQDVSAARPRAGFVVRYARTPTRS